MLEADDFALDSAFLAIKAGRDFAARGSFWNRDVVEGIRSALFVDSKGFVRYRS